MNGNRKNDGRAMTLPGGSLAGAFCALMWTLAAAGILSWLIQKEYLSENAVGYGSMIILLSASVIGGIAAQKKVKRRRLACGLLSGLEYFLMLLAMTALFFGGQYRGFGVTALLVFGGSGASVFFGMEGERRRGGRKRKIRV